MNIAEALKIKAAAKAYLGALAVAAQVALDYLPDHNTGWYTAAQVLLGVLGIIGIFAVPNKVAAAKQAMDQVIQQVEQTAPAVVVPDPAPVPVAAPEATPAP